jgi:hypothetical protein
MLRSTANPTSWSHQALTVRDKHPLPELARTVFDLIVQHELSSGAMARALVWRFESSASFDATRANLGALRRIPPEAWTPALTEQALTAHERNGQVAETFVGQSYAKDAVAELIHSPP